MQLFHLLIIVPLLHYYFHRASPLVFMKFLVIQKFKDIKDVRHQSLICLSCTIFCVTLFFRNTTESLFCHEKASKRSRQRIQCVAIVSFVLLDLIQLRSLDSCIFSRPLRTWSATIDDVQIYTWHNYLIF